MTGQPPPKARADADGRRAVGICLVLAAMTFAVFGQTLTHEFVNYDDDEYVYKNPVVVKGVTTKGIVWAFTQVDSANWHPLTWLSHELDCQLYGLRPGGHHLTSVLLHTTSVIALFLVLRGITGALWRSAFVAAVFAIHPLRVESVAWVAERKDVLSGLFFILTIGAYARYARRPRSWWRYGLVMLLFAMGLMSKPMLVTLPLVLLLLDYWPLQRMGPGKLPGLVLEKIPFLALAAIMCVVTLFAQKGVIHSAGSTSLSLRLANALVAGMVYLGQMVWPAGLAVFYPYPHYGLPVWEVGLAGTLLAGLSAVAWIQRRTSPWLLIGWLWYMLMLLPVLGIIQVGDQAHADRYTYLPQIGIYIAVTWLMAEWPLSRVVYGGLMVSVLTALMVCACKQDTYWENSETLWTHALNCTTGNYIAHGNLGEVLMEKGKVGDAMTHYEIALQINPNDAETHYNLGNALRQEGRLDDAMAQYQRAAQLEPNYVSAFVNLGSVLLQNGKAGEAAKQFQKALEIDPNHQRAHYNLGLCFYRLGRMDEAVGQYQKALQLEPADSSALNNLAWLLASCPQAALRDGRKAVELARQANAQTGGENPTMLHTLAAALAEAGQFPEAIETAQHALRLAEAHSNNRLAGQLQIEMQLYQAGNPFHTPAQTH